MNLFDTMMSSAFSEFQRVMPTVAEFTYYGDSTASVTLTGVLQVNQFEKSYDNAEVDVLTASFMCKTGDLTDWPIGSSLEIGGETWVLQGHTSIAGQVVQLNIEKADRKKIGTVRGAGRQA